MLRPMPPQALRTRPRPVLSSRLHLASNIGGRDNWTSVIDGWMVACHFTMQEGRLVIAELKCFPYHSSVPRSPWLGWRGGAVPAGG